VHAVSGDTDNTIGMAFSVEISWQRSCCRLAGWH